MARILDEKEKEAASLARILEEKKKESTDRDHYDKALADRLSIVAEGLAGDRLEPTCVVLLFDVLDFIVTLSIIHRCPWHVY